jgi:hypothetical protein
VSRLRWLVLSFTGVAALGLSWLLWNPYAATEQRFDRGHNGLWVGHKWYTGRHVRSDEPVGDEELQHFVDLLAHQRIRYAFVHVGPLLPDGSTEDVAGRTLADLRRLGSETLFLAWLGGIAMRLPVTDPGWRSAVVDTIVRLRDEGFDGVHLNVEPLENNHEGYIELLEEVRARLGDGFLLSHATRRAGPYGIASGPLSPSYWSEEFYRRTMELTDQSVLMAYDTKMDIAKLYVGFVKHQTRLLVDWGCDTPMHQVLIGVPAYEDVPLYSNPEIENIPNAVSGVRAALEESGAGRCFEGIAVYANWVTDEDEWAAYRRHWLDTEPLFR